MLFHVHRWTNVIHWSGIVQETRKCHCGKIQSLMYDYSYGGTRWVDGNFANLNPKKIFIFAASTDSLFKSIKELGEMYKDVEYVSMSSQGWDRMVGERSPVVFLAEDWADCNAIHDYRFAQLVTLGRIL